MATDAIFKRLGVTPEQLVGYYYAGVFVALAATSIDHDRVKSLVDALGSVLAAMVVFGIGIGTYVLHRRVVGELLLYPLIHLVHSFVDRLVGHTEARATSCTGYLRYLGVTLGNRRSAYNAIRSAFLDETTRRQLDLAHGELHVLFLTAIVSGVTAGIKSLSQRPVWSRAWVAVAVFCFIAGVVADIRQHSLETSLLRLQGESNVKHFLARGGFIELDQPLTKQHQSGVAK
jgi:hypothetical protein